MNAKEFVDAIRNLVMEAAVHDTVAILQTPPGRKPAPELVELSSWFKQLPDHDRAMVQLALGTVARQCLFGLLAVLDGSRKIDAAAAGADYFELRHLGDGTEDVLSGPRGESLHELL